MVRAGSPIQAASTCPPSMAAGIWSNGISANLIFEVSPRSLRTVSRIVVSLTFCSVFTATVLPTRSLADLIALSFLTATALMSLPTSPVEAVPLTTD
ncbi:hypothetical protein BX265_1776 [Streptomyces sp. TLI_235]|nr:hypothetical protein BX265_1776 [Streptomyces sp. TLI_235]